MKGLSAVLLGLGLALGLAASAQAAPMFDARATDQQASAVDPDWTVHPHHPCHGASAGTADYACGSLTGGPAGGLF